jgi:hypothetical protein
MPRGCGRKRRFGRRTTQEARANSVLSAARAFQSGAMAASADYRLGAFAEGVDNGGTKLIEVDVARERRVSQASQ